MLATLPVSVTRLGAGDSERCRYLLPFLLAPAPVSTCVRTYLLVGTVHSKPRFFLCSRFVAVHCSSAITGYTRYIVSFSAPLLNDQPAIVYYRCSTRKSAVVVSPLPYVQVHARVTRIQLAAPLFSFHPLVQFAPHHQYTRSCLCHHRTRSSVVQTSVRHLKSTL